MHEQYHHRIRSVLAVLAVATAASSCSPNNQGNLAAEGGDVHGPLAERGDLAAELVEQCGDVVVHERSEAAQLLRRMPYLQQTTARSTRVMWAGLAMAKSSLRVTTPKGDVVAESKARLDGRENPGIDRVVAGVQGLQPATVYCYEIVAEGDKPVIGRFGFRTAPEPGTGAATRFVVIGDSGDGTADQSALAEQMRTVPADLMLHVGDIAYSSGTIPEFDANFFDVYADMIRHVPFFPVPGNHEYRSDDAAPYRALFSLPGNERWYSFDWGDVHFVALDTEQMGDEQTEWLEKDLAKNDKPWTIAYLHKPPYSSGWHGSDEGVREAFSPLFERHGVPLVLTGHDHHYERTKPQNGVHYIVTGGGGAGTYPVDPSELTAHAEEVIQLLYVTVAGDELAVHAIDGTGKEFDQLIITR